MNRIHRVRYQHWRIKVAHYIVPVLNVFVHVRTKFLGQENGESLVQWFDTVPSIYKHRDCIRVLHNTSIKSTDDPDLKMPHRNSNL